MSLAKELADAERARTNPYEDQPQTFAHQSWALNRELTVLYYEFVAALRIDRLAEWLVRRLRGRAA